MFGLLKQIKETYDAKAFMRSLLGAEIRPLRSGSVPHTTEVIVSLTSYGERLGNVDLAIRSILANTVVPDRIILWVDEETKGKLPARVQQMEDYGVEIRRGVENLRPHNKYFYTMRENPDSIVITVDDDEMYAADTVQTLLEQYVRHPGCVIARRVHRILWNATGTELLPYGQWGWEWHESSEPRMDLIATGVGGVLYPPHSIGERALNADAIKQASLGADDIWLKVNEVIDGAPVVYAPNKHLHPLTIPDSQGETLNASNVWQGQNTRILRNVLRYFGLTERDFIGMMVGS